jgi:Rrf2 family iron-sulfur cluster assembly transcriptional regulator
MKLGAKARYAVMAMVDLARQGGREPAPLAGIAERQEISLAYLEQLFAQLRRAGLVTSARGPGGGFRLARGPGDIRIAEIVTAVEEEMRATRCHIGSPHGCRSDKARCLTHDLWEELGRQIHLFMNAVTLEDVVDGRLLGAARLFEPARTVTAVE